MLRSVLETYREELVFNRDKGDQFERLIRTYLDTDPQYVALFSDVWLGAFSITAAACARRI